VIPPSHLLIDRWDGVVAGSRFLSVVKLKVASTESLVDDRWFGSFGAFIHVTGTTTYTAVDGGSRTVLAAEMLSLESLKKH
jgi:hypothetical protein